MQSGHDRSHGDRLLLSKAKHLQAVVPQEQTEDSKAANITPRQAFGLVRPTNEPL